MPSRLCIQCLGTILMYTSIGWVVREKRVEALINFLVNSPEGTFFYKIVDESDSIKNRNYLWQLFDNMVEEIGQNNVLQVVTGNHSSYINVIRSLWKVGNHFIRLIVLYIALI